MKQLPMEIVCDDVSELSATTKSKRAGAFTDNMSLPVHRWFRYSAGFSAEWVELLIDKQSLKSGDYVFDPFAGSGTTLLAAQTKNVNAAGAEYHPFVFRIAQTKLLWKESETELLNICQDIIHKAKSRTAPPELPKSNLLTKCYSPEALNKLEAIRDIYLLEHSKLGSHSELIWLAITAILRECSGVGTAQWQYVLPNKVKAHVRDPYIAFKTRMELFARDMRHMKERGGCGKADIRFCDARDLSSFSHLEGRVKLVVTSPPYPNNYDYADATRLEMTFWGEIGKWADLQPMVRHRLVRSCSQHAAAERLCLEELLEDADVSPIRKELKEVCNKLAAIRETKGGKKTYHTMIAAYFGDLAKTWKALYPLCAKGADICFIIGDSAPYGIHVPAERWLGQLALSAGFHSWAYEKLRDRNIKWKNRKHRIPLQEGFLWVKN